MESKAANSKWGRLHEKRPWHDGTFDDWVEEPDAAHPYYKDWGVMIGVTDTDLRPDDDFLSPSSDEVDGEQDDAADTAEEGQDSGNGSDGL